MNIPLKTDRLSLCCVTIPAIQSCDINDTDLQGGLFVPTERFLNLPEEKRERILIAAIDEFTRVPYEDVSINKIIQSAKISRGSFYQYFADKQDLLEYLMKDFRAKMISAATNVLKSNGGDPFAVFKDLLVCFFEFADSHDNPEFFNNIYSCVSARHLRKFSFMRLQADEIFESFGRLIDEEAFRGISQETKKDIIDMQIVLLHNEIVRRFTENTTTEAAIREFERKTDILKEFVNLKGEHNAQI